MCARLAVVVLAALALPASAQAHAFLESSTPANGTSLGRAPHVVSLHFTEPVSAGLAHVQLFDGRGRQRAGVRVRGGRTASELVVSLPALGTGAYRIAWSTVSQDDLHVTRGALVFGAGAAAPAIRASAGATPPTSLTESAAHLLDLVSLSILIAVCGLLAAPCPQLCELASPASGWPLCRRCWSQASWHSTTRHRSCHCATSSLTPPGVTQWSRASLLSPPSRSRSHCAGHESRSHCSYPSPQRKPRVDMPRRRARWHWARNDTAHPRGRTLGGRADRARRSSCPAPSDATSARRSPASAASPRPASAC